MAKEGYGLQAMRYLWVGGLAAVIDISFFFYFATVLDYNYLIVSAIGFILATFANFTLGSRYVFDKSHHKKLIEVSLVYGISILGALLHLALLFVLVSLFSLDEMLSKLVVSGVVFVWNFILRKAIVYRTA